MGVSPRDRRTGELLPFQESPPRIAELLAYDLAISESISSVVWSLLSALKITPLLPNLRLLCHKELEWECCHPDYRQNAPLHTPSMLFGSKLLFADIFCVDPNRNADHATELVDALSDVATTLEYLNIEARPDDPLSPSTGYLRNPALSVFQCFKTFSSATIRVAPDALMALSGLSSLKSLHLHVDPSEYLWDDLPHKRRADFFPALKQLTLHKIDFGWSAAFLRVLPSTSLETLSLRCEADWQPPPMLLMLLCTAISELPSVRSIVSISIIIGSTIYDAYQVADGYVYWPDDIAPLFTVPLHALRRLAIQGQCVLSVDDYSLEAIAQTCPNITELILEWNRHHTTGPDSERTPDDDDFPCVTPVGLLDLARGCPRLTKLAVAMNMRCGQPTAHPDNHYGFERAPFPPVYFSGPAAPALRDFDAKGSVLDEDPARIASLLSLLFPRLSAVSSYFESQTWSDLGTLQSTLARVRAQESASAERAGKRLRGLLVRRRWRRAGVQ